MKIKLPLLAGLASLAALVGAHAQTAVTDPVGYITINVTGGGTVALPKESLIGTPLTQKVEFAGTVSTVAGTALGFAGTPFTAGQFSGVSGAFYIEVTNGTNSGVWTDIVSNTANGVVTLDDISSLVTAATSTVKIRKHNTISSLFGANNEIGGFAGGVDISTADQLLLLNAATQTPTIVYFSTDDLNPGWVTAAGASAASLIVEPGAGIQVKRKGTAPLAIVNVGYVKTGPTWIPVETGLNLLSAPLATGTTLAQSGLVASGIGTGVDISTADEVQLLTAGNLGIFFNSTDDLNPGWVTASGTPSETQPLTEGGGLVIKRKTAAFNWKAPAQVIAN